MFTLLARLPYIVAEGQVDLTDKVVLSDYMVLPAQRPAEVLGTPMHAQLHVLSNCLHYAPFARHW